MGEKIIGRKNEVQLLTELLDSPKAEFVAIYGRRRIGKTSTGDGRLWISRRLDATKSRQW